MINLYSIIVGLFSVAGAVTALWSWKNISRKRQTGTWPCTEGVIIESSKSSKENDLLPLVKFSYAVKQIDLEGKVQLPQGESAAPDFAERFTRQYPVGEKIMVYYNPDEPHVNTLKPGVSREDWLVFGIGVAACVLGLLFIGINI